MNSYLPGIICQKFRGSKIVAFSSGNVYPFTPVAWGGAREHDAPQPVGDYAMSVLGRERIYEHFGRTLKIPLVTLRLNYAAELRYGVLVDIARRVDAGEPVDLAMGYFNTIWQGDANAMTLRAFDHCEVPGDSILGSPGDGFGVLLSALNMSRPSIAAEALGIACAAFDAAE